MFACRSWIVADWSVDCATASCSWRSAVEAFASTSPALTALPTWAETSVTDQVPEPAVALESVVRTGAAPNPRSYPDFAAIVPVAATLSVTSPVDAAAVRYWVALALPANGSPPPTETKMAAPPGNDERGDHQQLELHGRDGPPCGSMTRTVVVALRRPGPTSPSR